MKKDKKFILRLSMEDLSTLQRVSRKIQRSKSDSVRWALREVDIALDKQPERLQLLKQVKRPD